jgi:DNA-directed RNA polymerase subunit RPC12/RpoP
MLCKTCGKSLWNMVRAKCSACDTPFLVTDYAFPPRSAGIPCEACGEKHPGLGPNGQPLLQDGDLVCRKCQFHTPVDRLTAVMLTGDTSVIAPLVSNSPPGPTEASNPPPDASEPTMICTHCGESLWNMPYARCPACNTPFKALNFAFSPGQAGFPCAACGEVHPGQGPYYHPTLEAGGLVCRKCSHKTLASQLTPVLLLAASPSSFQEDSPGPPSALEDKSPDQPANASQASPAPWAAGYPPMWQSTGCAWLFGATGGIIAGVIGVVLTIAAISVLLMFSSGHTTERQAQNFLVSGAWLAAGAGIVIFAVASILLVMGYSLFILLPLQLMRRFRK